jgi:hypothetical protein
MTAQGGMAAQWRMAAQVKMGGVHCAIKKIQKNCPSKLFL